MRRIAGVALVCLALARSHLHGSDVIVKPMWGVVCLAEQTGIPQWEYFPPDIAWFRMQLYEDRIVIEQQGGTATLDPATGEEKLFVDEPSSEATVPRRENTTTLSGNVVVAAPHNARAVTVLKRAGPDVHRVIPTDRYYHHLVVHGDLAIYAPSYWGWKKETGPAAVAVDTNTGEVVWQLEDSPGCAGLSRGVEYVYVAESERLRAVDPATGREVWRERVPRLQGWAHMTETEQSVLIHCDSNPDGQFEHAFIYCLDKVTGKMRWSFDPHAGGSVPLYARSGRVYTHIGPSGIASFLDDSSRCSLAVPRRPWDEPYRRGPACLSERFAQKTPGEIELNLRAWQALGDRALIPALEAAKPLVANTPLAALPEQLVAAFPRARDEMTLLQFLSDRFAKEPDLGPEVRRILEAFDPVPYWLKRPGGMLTSGQSHPVFDLEPQEKAVIGAFRVLKAQVDGIPTTRMTQDAIAELILGQATASFESLVTEHDQSTDSDRRLLLRMALYAQHPKEASDWALQHLDGMSAMEITQWVQRAPMEWLLDHRSLYESWLHHDDRAVRSFSAHRLGGEADAELVRKYCVQILERGLNRVEVQDVDALRGAMRGLSNSSDPAYAALLRRYLRDHEPLIYGGRLHSEATWALEKLGITVPSPLRSSGAAVELEKVANTNDNACVAVYRLAQKLQGAEDAGRETEARDYAQKILDALRPPAACDYVDDELSRAYEALEEWDLAIQYTLVQQSEMRDIDRDLVRIYDKSGRIDELAALVERTPREDDAIAASFALIRHERLNEAKARLEMLLKANPSQAEACIGLALIEMKLRRPEQADALMDRAISLRPHPYATGFEHTFTYWLERREPDKARAWLRESARIDRSDWERGGFIWAEQFDELASTVAELRSP